MKNLENIRIDELLPDQLRETAANLLAFLKVYYTQQNQDSAPTQLIQFLNENQDLDRVADDKFINTIADSIAKDIPKSVHVERTRLLKRLVDYYNLKGTKRSIEIFFRLFFNKSIKITEPWENVLIPSDGRFSTNPFVRIVADTPNSVPSSIVGKTIFQKNRYGANDAQGFVNRLEKREYDETIYTIYFDESSVVGTFVPGQKLVDSNDFNYGTLYRSLSSVTINNGGSGYKVGDRLFLDTRDNTSFELIVRNVNDRGVIQGLKIVDLGAGNTIGSLPVKAEDFKIQGNTDTVASFLRLKRKDGATLKPDGVQGDLVDLTYNFSALVTTIGSAPGIKGRLSDGIVTQDSEYYQKFSYELTTDLPFSSFRKSFNDIIHPSGYKVFNVIRRETTPPIGFGFDKSLAEIKKIVSAVFQPGNGTDVPHIYAGFGDPDIDYEGDPDEDRPDEKIPLTAVSGIARDNFTTFQSPSSVAATNKVTIENAENAALGKLPYPKNNYFMEDFVSENSSGGGFTDVQKFL